MKFKVGDIVKVREDLESGEEYNEVIFDERMKEFKGKTYKIKQVVDEEESYFLEGCYYNSKSSTYWWYFNDEMLEAVDDDFETVTFGSYYKNNSNTKEPIEWIVLEKTNGKALLITKYGIDCKKYNETYTDVTWETCSLRYWLNNTFLNNAFSNEERNKIQNTSDKVFLLSIEEAKKYFSSSDSRKCQPTPYAIQNGVYTVDGDGWWWLRSPGNSQSSAAYVDYGGLVYSNGYRVSRGNDCVRPALWINLESEIVKSKTSKIIAVNHLNYELQPINSVYYFKITDDVEVGDLVYCDTCYGLAVCKVVKIYTTLDEVFELPNLPELRFMKECRKELKQ